ncbi:hypothetical protein [Candidatus Binatus sp.]|uniref:hypothetical protein n=1 Tax=Candidatus Binatus sp. TaxID=2811406 RepID=UPI003C3741E3
MPTEQTNSQRRFTVIELPVFPIVKESLLLPFNYMPELVKFGKMPFLLILAVDLLCYGLERQDISKSLTGTLMMVAHFVLFTPFSVAWTKLAIHGRRSVANHPAFAYSRTQWMYLLATTVMILALLISVGVPFVLLRNFQRNFENELMILAGGGLFVGLGIYVIGYLRLQFVFPAIAIGRYAGISASWKQTAGNIERLAAIVLLSYLPYWLIRLTFEWYMGYHPPGVIEAFRGCIEMLLVTFATTALAGPALAYKALVLDQPQDETATPAISAAR